MTNFALMTAIAFIMFMSAGITGPVRSLYVASLGASYVAIGLLGTVTSLTTILFSYLWGRASDHLGQRKGFMVLSLAVMALSYALMALVPSYAYLFPLRVLGAIAHAAYGTASLALMGDLLEQRGGERGRKMGTFRGLASLGFGLMAFISGSIADWLSLRVPFGMAAFFLIVAFFLALQVKESPPAASRERIPGQGSHGLRSLVPAMWRDLRSSAGRLVAALKRGKQEQGGASHQDEQADRLPLIPLLVSAFLWSLVTGAVYAVWANYMVSEMAYSQAAMSRLWALASLSEFPLMILAGWLSDKVGRLPMLSLGFVAWTLVFVGYVFVPVMPWIVFVQLTRGFAYSAFTATAMTYATEVRAKEQRGAASGLYHSAGGVGSILGSSMGGILTEVTGFRTMFATSAALILGGAGYMAAVAFRRAARFRGMSRRM